MPATRSSVPRSAQSVFKQPAPVPVPKKPVEKRVPEAKPVEETREEEKSEEEQPIATPSSLHQLPPRTIAPNITGHPIVRRIGQILQNGTKYGPHAQIRFNAHTGLLIQLENTYNNRLHLSEEEAEKRFLEALQTYLEQAAMHIPHAARPEEVPGMVEQLRALLHEDQSGGLPLVGRYLLAVARAPLDRF